MTDPARREETETLFDPGTRLTNEEIDVRARRLLAQLTLHEKTQMMDGDTPFWPGLSDMMSGGYAKHTWNAGVIARLRIPGVRFSDGPRGVVMDGATTFPVPMARGATWDPALEERIGDTIGRELRAKGGTFFGGICINLLRHPAWGRAQETYGEDPYHLGEMGAALTRGVQRHVMACAKHYALNSMENARFTVDVTIRPRPLHEVYLPQFKRVVDEGVAAVMSAYNSVNGEWCGQNKTLLTDILKNRWGFLGFVLTDFIFGMRDARGAALAGQDVEMPFQMHFHQHLKSLVEDGEVPLERVDDAVLRVLRQQFRLLQPGDYPEDLVGSPDHRAIAREAAERAIVLLQNNGDLLPLQAVGTIAVIGRLADTPNTGDTGSSGTRPASVVTPLGGMRAALQGKAEVHYDDGSQLDRALNTARGADAVLLVVGYDHRDEGEFLDPATFQDLAQLFPPPSAAEAPLHQSIMQSFVQKPDAEILTGGDRDRLTLHPAEESLIQAVADVNPRTVVALMGGSAVIMENWRHRVAAILMLWYPGMESGHALADILLGRVNPSGKLPQAIPQRAEHLPFFDKNATVIEYDLWHGYRKLERDGNAPAFPFGFGLSYTRYAYANLTLAQARVESSGVVRATWSVSNVGTRAGAEVVQLYVRAVGSAVERAPKDLKGFARVVLQPGESTKVEFDLPASRLAYFDETRSDFVVEPIEYELFVGAHSLDPQALTARFRVV